MFRVTLLLFPSANFPLGGDFHHFKCPCTRNISLMRHRLAGDCLNLSSPPRWKIFNPTPLLMSLLGLEWKKIGGGYPLKRIKIVKIHEEYSQTVHVPTCRFSFPCLPIKDSRWTRSARIRLRGHPSMYRPITG